MDNIILDDDGKFKEIAEAVKTVIESIKYKDLTPAFANVDVGMPAKIPLYDGPAAIIDLITSSANYAFRKKLITLSLQATITILTKGKPTTSTLNNYKLTYGVFKALILNTYNALDGLRINPPENNCITFGLLPQNRIAVKQGDRAALYSTGQFLINLDYSGEI